MHLLLKSVLPFQNGIEVVGTVGTLAGPEETALDDVSQHLLHGLAVLFVDAHQEEREHDQHHAHGGGAGSHGFPQQEEQRDAQQAARPEADHLPLGQVEGHLGFDPREVLGHRNVGDNRSLPYVVRIAAQIYRAPLSTGFLTSGAGAGRAAALCWAFRRAARAEVFSMACPARLKVRCTVR